jgi:hypothetical protein
MHLGAELRFVDVRLKWDSMSLGDLATTDQKLVATLMSY